jgi:hypothetical protein
MLLSELLQQVLPRVQGPVLCDLFAAVREVHAVIANRLLLRASDLLQQATEAELTYAVDAQTASLPDDFRALAERPYIAGEKPLAPLDRRSTENLQDAGTPVYYKVLGRTLWIYPPTAAEVTVQVPYFAQVTAPAALTDELPFLGEFDRVYVEGATIVMRSGLAAVAEKTFVAMIQSQVDAVLDARDRLAEQQLADAINDY